jgi:BirA family biotin operon repressor/biotin-[acetyl-CoA-carboxylase] ligase
VLQPAVPAPRLPELSLVAGAAVAGAIAAETSLSPSIKHPNDVLVDGKKVAGILAESSEGRVVLGIGVNANQAEAELPAATQTVPTSLLLETGRPVERAALLAAILRELERAYDAWLRDTAARG